MLLTKIFLKVDMKWSQPHASNKAHFEILQKEKEGIFMLCFGHAFMLLLTKSTKDKFSALELIPHILETKRRNSLFSHYSLSLFIHYCSWHCSLQIFAYLRGVVPYVWNKFEFRTSFLERVSPSRPFFERVPYLL